MKGMGLLIAAGVLGLGSVPTSLCAQTGQSTAKDGTLLLAQAEHGNMPTPGGSREAGSAEAVQGRGTVQTVEKERRKVTLAHEPIPEWQWPAMTMAFDVAEDVDLSTLEEGAEIAFSLVRTEEGGQVLTRIRPLQE